MHLLSKKEVSSGELETLKRSRYRITVVTANGEVQTNEEAQVYVHDLHIFVTVQLLEGAPAVLSLGKLCNEHGFSYDWPSGREPRLTQNEIQTLCNSGNFVPLVGSGHSSSSTTASSSTSPPQDLPVSVGPANTQRNEGTTGNCSEGVAGNCKEEGIPEWPEDFTENLKIAEVPAPADISHDSDLERSVIMEAQYFLLTSQKTKITRSAREPRFRGLLAEDELEKQRNLDTQRIQSYPCKTKTSQETERAYRNFSSRLKSRKSSTLTIRWHLANPVKTCDGIIILPHLIDL